MVLLLNCLKQSASKKRGIFGLFKNIEPTCLEGCQKIVNLKFDPSSYEQMTEEEAIESMKGISDSNLIKWNCVTSCEPLWRYDCTQNCLE